MKGNSWKKEKHANALQSDYLSMKASSCDWRRKGSYRKKLRRFVTSRVRNKSKEFLKHEMNNE